MDQMTERAWQTLLNSAADGYCPTWELMDEVAQECAVDSIAAAVLIEGLTTKIEAHGEILFFRSDHPYAGEMVPVTLDEVLAAAIRPNRRINDGAPYFFIHLRRKYV